MPWPRTCSWFTEEPGLGKDLAGPGDGGHQRWAGLPAASESTLEVCPLGADMKEGHRIWDAAERVVAS